MELTEKFKQLEQNVILLRELKNDLDLEAIEQNRRYEWELRYGLFESVQIIIDVSCKITNHFNLGNPKNYRECLEFLKRFGYLDADLSKRCISMIGLRNLLIHEYAHIDTKKLFDFLDHIDDFSAFITQIQHNLK